VQTVSTYDRLDGASLSIEDGWRYHIVDLTYKDSKHFKDNKANLLDIASIPGVRAYGNANQETGYSWLEKESKENSIKFHVDSVSAFIFMLQKWKN
jgi:hypothetical protein